MSCDCDVNSVGIYDYGCGCDCDRSCGCDCDGVCDCGCGSGSGSGCDCAGAGTLQNVNNYASLQPGWYGTNNDQIKRKVPDEARYPWATNAYNTAAPMIPEPSRVSPACNAASQHATADQQLNSSTA